MQRQNIGTPFLERILRTGKKRNALLNTPVSGGVNLPSPTGLGSGQQPPPRRTPAADVSQQLGRPAAPAPTTAPTPAPAAAPRQQQPPPQEEPLPPLDAEFPADHLRDSDGGKVLAAGRLSDRFYRVYGRMPTDTEAYTLSLRKQYEQKVGRPPSKGEIVAALQRTYETQKEAQLV